MTDVLAINAIRARAAREAQEAADTAYTMGRYHGAVAAHNVAVRLVAARARRDLDVIKRNKALIEAAPRA